MIQGFADLACAALNDEDVPRREALLGAGHTRGQRRGRQDPDRPPKTDHTHYLRRGSSFYRSVARLASLRGLVSGGDQHAGIRQQEGQGVFPATGAHGGQ